MFWIQLSRCPVRELMFSMQPILVSLINVFLWKWWWIVLRWKSKNSVKVSSYDMRTTDRLKFSVFRPSYSIYWIFTKTKPKFNLVSINIQFNCYARYERYNKWSKHVRWNLLRSTIEFFLLIKGFTKTKRYLQSIGRYGNSPFLHQQYGSGEISQCFSRLCAVFGGIQYLRFPLAGFIEDDVNQRCTGISSITGEQFRAADAVICNHIFVPTSVTYKTKVIERIILITNQSIKPSNDEEVNYTFSSSKKLHQSCFRSHLFDSTMIINQIFIY